MKSIILLCLVVYCATQTPMPCVSPQQWEGRIFQVDPSKEFELFGNISYDESNKRVRIIEELRLGSSRDYYDTLFLHNTQKEYKLNLRTRECNVTTLDRPFRPFGIPPFAKFFYEGVIGAAGTGGENLTAQIVGLQSQAKLFITSTYPSCLPISNFYFSNETGNVFTNFYDISLGIADPPVFEPPTECA